MFTFWFVHEVFGICVLGYCKVSAYSRDTRDDSQEIVLSIMRYICQCVPSVMLSSVDYVSMSNGYVLEGVSAFSRDSVSDGLC